MHKYGHYIDNRHWGPIYLSGIGIPSIFSAAKKDGNHRNFWSEKRANRRAEKYFRDNYNINWNYSNYPL